MIKITICIYIVSALATSSTFKEAYKRTLEELYVISPWQKIITGLIFIIISPFLLTGRIVLGIAKTFLK